MISALVLCLAAIALANGSPSTSLGSEFDPVKTKAVVTKEIEKELAKGTASVSIALVRGDDIVWTAAFGWANVWAQTPATPATIYVTGSTFKAVTATAMMQLVERGTVALDDAVNDHLRDAHIRDRGDQWVTIRHILSHASGLNAGANTTPLWQRRLPQTLVQLTSELEAVRAPEVAYEYNNYAYGLAGFLIEQVSGIDYQRFIVQNILKPLGVTTPAPVEPTPEMVERMALPYEQGQDGKPKPIAQVRYDVYPAGDIYLTAEDMARFLAAHLNGGVFRGQRILSEASIAETHRRQFFDYGLGWFLPRNSKHRLVYHAGGVPGFTTFMLGDLDARVGAYVMSNSGDMEHVAKAAVALLRGDPYIPPEERAAITLDEAVLQSYVGRYEGPNKFMLTVTRSGQQLFIQATGQPKSELFAAAETEFFLRSTDAQVSFRRTAAGTVDELILNQSGDIHATRIK